jgi:hypothetical protein
MPAYQNVIRSLFPEGGMAIKNAGKTVLIIISVN